MTKKRTEIMPGHTKHNQRNVPHVAKNSQIKSVCDTTKFVCTQTRKTTNVIFAIEPSNCNAIWPCTQRNTRLDSSVISVMSFSITNSNCNAIRTRCIPMLVIPVRYAENHTNTNTIWSITWKLTKMPIKINLCVANSAVRYFPREKA